MTPTGTLCSSDCQVQGRKDLANYFRPLPDGYGAVPSLGRGMDSYPKIPRAWWSKIAEIEIAVIGRECLRRRAGDRATLERQVVALEAERNAQHRTITWSFTAFDARTKLRRLYPTPQS